MTGMRPRDFIQTARPAQWLKNAFVLAPVVFARSLDDPDALWRAVVAAALFSLVASGVYFAVLRDSRQVRITKMMLLK